MSNTSARLRRFWWAIRKHHVVFTPKSTDRYDPWRQTDSVIWCTRVWCTLNKIKKLFLFCGECGSSWLWLQQPEGQRCPYLPVYCVLLCVQIMVWLPVFVIYNVCADADASNFFSVTVRESALNADSGRTKSLAAPVTRTRVNNAPCFSVPCSAHWAIPDSLG